jgi:N,N'-diacetyllegionaminate synthase
MSKVAPIDIAGRKVGPGHPCFIIAEVAQAHDGSLGTAHAYIDAAADAKADVVKFQTHIAASESTVREPWRVKFSQQDATRYDYWRRMEFTEEQWAGLQRHAHERGLLFLSSAFSPEAVDLLSRLGMPAWKVASGEVSNLPLIRKMTAAGGPLLISSGMSKHAEVASAVSLTREAGRDVAVFQCTSAYPCPPEKVGIHLIPDLAARYGCPVGLSDHSGTPYPSLAAVTLGASMLEVHIVLSRTCFGPDTPSSLTPQEFSSMVQGIRYTEIMVATSTSKDDLAADASGMRSVFGKSIVARRDLPAGTVLAESDLALKKPGDGLPPSRLAAVIGRTLATPLVADQALLELHLQ